VIARRRKNHLPQRTRRNAEEDRVIGTARFGNWASQLPEMPKLPNIAESGKQFLPQRSQRNAEGHRKDLKPQRTQRNAKEDQAIGLARFGNWVIENRHIVPFVTRELPDAAWQRTGPRDPSTSPHAVRRSVPLRTTGLGSVAWVASPPRTI